MKMHHDHERKMSKPNLNFNAFIYDNLTLFQIPADYN